MSAADAQAAKSVAMAITDLVGLLVSDGAATVDQAIAGVRWATITLHAALEIQGHDTALAEATVERLLDEAQVAADTPKGKMQ